MYGRQDDEWDALVREGIEWIPNIPHVFRQDQHLYFLYEVYDPAKEQNATQQQKPHNGKPVRVMTSIEFIRDGLKVYETPLITANAINVPQRDAVGFQFDVPVTQLKPGTYICQVNVIDDAGGNFSFPRLALMVRANSTPATTTASTAKAPASAP